MRRSRFTINQYFLLAFILAAAIVLPCRGAHLDEVFLPYAVDLEMRSWPGTAVYLGNGQFLTAAHVVGRSWLSRPQVLIGDRRLPAATVKEGSPQGTDLTLLAVDKSLLPMRLRLRQTQLCARAPWPGEAVVTVAPNAVVHSHVLSPRQLPPDLRHLTSVIDDVAATGNSGSGVFDVHQKCLLGIVTQKISQSRAWSGPGRRAARDIAKFFVPAAVIAGFLPQGSVTQAAQ